MKALESPTLIEKRQFSKITIPKKVHPENEISIPEISSSSSVFLRAFRMYLESIFFSAYASTKNSK